MHGIDGCGDFVVFKREDEKLHRLPAAVYDIVEKQVGDDERTIAVEQFFDVAGGQQEAGGDNNQIAEHHLSQRDVFIFIDDGGNDVGTTGRTVAQEDESDADALDSCTENARHKHAVFDQLRHALLTTGEFGMIGRHLEHHLSRDEEQEGEHTDRIDGFDAKFPSQHLHGDDQQDDVDGEKGEVHGNAGCVKQYRSRTGQSAGGDFVGQLETSEAHGIAEQTESDDDVVACILKQRQMDVACHM